MAKKLKPKAMMEELAGMLGWTRVKVWEGSDDWDSPDGTQYAILPEELILEPYDKVKLLYDCCVMRDALICEGNHRYCTDNPPWRKCKCIPCTAYSQVSNYPKSK